MAWIREHASGLQYADVCCRMLSYASMRRMRQGCRCSAAFVSIRK